VKKACDEKSQRSTMAQEKGNPSMEAEERGGWNENEETRHLKSVPSGVHQVVWVAVGVEEISGGAHIKQLKERKKA